MAVFAPPPAVVGMNLAANGAAGRAWLEALPAILATLEARWSLDLGPPFAGGCVAYVAPGTRPDGAAVVVKVSLEDDETRHEGDALAVWDGDGAVRLLDRDTAHGALLLERLEPGTPLSEHPDRGAAITIGCALLRRLWRPLPAGHPFPPAGDLAHRWATELPGEYRRLGQPFDDALLQHAVRCAERLALAAGPAVLVNRDFHFGNVLSAGRERWLVIDPKPLAGEPAFDTGHLVRDLLPPALGKGAVQDLVRRLAAELELEPERIAAWALVRSVENALWQAGTGDADLAWDVDCARLLGELAGSPGR